MDVLEKFLRKVSYKFPKGYPDITDNQDMILLENILNNLLKEEVQFRPLEYGELKKSGREYRISTIYNKIQDKKPFVTTTGEVILQFNNPEHAEVFKNEDKEGIKTLGGRNVNIFPFFKDNKDKTYGLRDLLKTTEFGGKGSGSGTVVEDRNLGILKELIKDILDSTGKSSITVKIGNETHPNIVGAETQAGMPKSDFNLIDTSGKPVVFISHKKGSNAGDFIRWSGFTMYADDSEVQAFNNALKKFISDNNLEGVPRASAFIAPVKSPELIRELIYGPEYGGNYSKENVNIILQGTPKLTEVGDGVYELGSNHTLIPPQLPEGDYAPYLTSKYRSDRTMFGIPDNEAIARTKAVSYRASNVYELKKGEFIKVK